MVVSEALAESVYANGRILGENVARVLHRGSIIMLDFFKAQCQ